MISVGNQQSHIFILQLVELRAHRIKLTQTCQVELDPNTPKTSGAFLVNTLSVNIV